MTTATRTENRAADRIEKSVALNASQSRVWRALTDHNEFGAWFRVQLDGPFRAGEVATGKSCTRGTRTFPGTRPSRPSTPNSTSPLRGIPMQLTRASIIPTRRLPWSNFTWRNPAPERCSRSLNRASAIFRTSDATRPFLRNSEGWGIQMKNIEEYVAQHP